MKFPSTVRSNCPRCLNELEIPVVQAIDAPSDDKRYAGYMVVLDMQAARDHIADHGDPG